MAKDILALIEEAKEKAKEQLWQGKPGQRVFTAIPKYNRKRIFGTENEYGTTSITPSPTSLPNFIPNGGRIYYDCLHIEYASPETSNPLEAIVYGKAGELLAQKYASKIYKNNVDTKGDTFGAHENYFIQTSLEEVRSIIPFLITRQIFAGAGRLKRDASYEIAQRSSKISSAVNNKTTDDRAILNTKNEPLADLLGWWRLHLILGDANMCEVADFLKLGTTGLVLDLAEDGKLPKRAYLDKKTVYDIQMISKHLSQWMCGEEKATNIQREYLSAAKAYQGRDPITDEILLRWESTLDALDEDPMQLIGMVDWVTKKALIDQYQKQHQLPPDHPQLRNIDLQYHDTSRDGLFYTLQKQGKIERIITDSLIEHATTHPPKDTRAFFRGNAVKRGIKEVSWDEFIDPQDGKWCESCRAYHGNQVIVKLNNPFNTYENLLEKLDKKEVKDKKPKKNCEENSIPF